MRWSFGKFLALTNLIKPPSTTNFIHVGSKLYENIKRPKFYCVLYTNRVMTFCVRAIKSQSYWKVDIIYKKKRNSTITATATNEILEKKIRLTYSSTKTFMRGQSTTTNKRKEEKSPVSISAINQWIWCGILHEIECKKKNRTVTNPQCPPTSHLFHMSWTICLKGSLCGV